MSVAAIVPLGLPMAKAEQFWIANALSWRSYWPGVRLGEREDLRLPARILAMAKPTRVTNSIRALRFAHGEMTQADLAGRLGVTHQTVIAIEQGRYSHRWRWPSRSPGCSRSPSPSDPGHPPALPRGPPTAGCVGT